MLLESIAGWLEHALSAAIKSGGHYFGRLGRFWRAGRRAPQATIFTAGGVFTVNTFSHRQAVAGKRVLKIRVSVVSHFLRPKKLDSWPPTNIPDPPAGTPKHPATRATRAGVLR